MSNKFLIKNLNLHQLPLSGNDYAIVEKLSISYKVPMSDIYKDVLSNRLSVNVSRPEAKGPNVLSLMYLDDNHMPICLTSTNLQDGMLSAINYDSSSFVLSLYFNAIDPQSSVLTVNLSSLNNIYEFGYGLSSSDIQYGKRISVDTNVIQTKLTNEQISAIDSIVNDTAIPYQFSNVEINNGMCIVSSHTTSIFVVDSNTPSSFSLSILPNENNLSAVRKLTFVMDYIAEYDGQPNISVLWNNAYFSPYSSSADFECIPGKITVYDIVEYVPNKFYVQRWISPIYSY